MPDYIRAQVDAMGPPRSPAGSDSPLSLVIYKKGHDHHVRQHRHEHALTIHMTPASPSRSSGFSETDESPHQNNAEHFHDVIMADENGDEAGNLVVAVEEEVVDGQEEEEEVPLSLVVEKHVSSDDSGHGEDDGRFFHPEISFERRSRIENEDAQRVEIEPKVTIARVQDRSSSSEELNATATGIKIKDFARFNMENAEAVQIPPEIMRYEHTRAALLAPRKSKTSESDDEDDDDDSEMSSDDSWGTESAHEGGTPRAYPCHYCDKVFANRHHLMSHVVTHTGERNFSCRKCGKCFGRKSTLRAHMTTHTGTSNFMCPLCDKACNDNNSLEEHIRMHTGEKPFVCAICSKAYARKSHLNVHYRVHTGERPFVCTDCGKDFTEKRFLNDHAQTAHNGHDGPLKCPNCFREFAYKTSLKQHLKKQMCVKNLNRGQGGQGHGAHAKQFACPFCEKSYSWKQTLKQHVSMYHRNKVHTDEFWKYELAKHRRTVLDNETNEDMWRRQLGKHASLGSGSGEMILNRRASIHGSLLHELDPCHEDKWLDQIKRSSEGPANADMKLLALRSLHSSLQHMSASAAATASLRYGSEHQQPLGRQEEEEEFAPTREDGYLAMLANVSYNRREREPSQDWQQSIQQQQQPQAQDSKSTSNSPQWEVLKDIMEEPAAKRTQMWLAQLGQYRQRELQEELDRSHDELWEEQIARIKHNPIRSPLEAVEITIDEDQDEAKAIAAATARKMEQRNRPPAMLPLMMSALQVRPAPPPPPPPALSPILSRGPSPQRLTLTLHSSDGESDGSNPRKVPAYYTEESNNNNNNNNNVVIPRHVPLAPPPLPQRSLPIPIPRIAHPVKPDGPSPKSNSPPTDSVLKSLLLDAAASRKRPISPSPTATAVVATSPLKSRFSVSDETDILRRRLLGHKDVVEPAATTPSKIVMPMPRFAAPSATVTSKDLTPLKVTSPVQHYHISPQQQQQRPLDNGGKSVACRIPLLSLPDDVSSEEDRSRSSVEDKEQPQQQQQQQQPCLNDSSYKRTSVLKHLLHRYNNDATDNNNSSSSNNSNNNSSKGEF